MCELFNSFIKTILVIHVSLFQLFIYCSFLYTYVNFVLQITVDIHTYID